MTKRIFLVLLPLSALAGGCGGAAKEAMAMAPVPPAMRETGQPSPEYSAQPPAPSPPPAGGGTAPAKAKETIGDSAKASHMIYTAALRLDAEETKAAQTMDRIIDIAESFGGGLLSRRDDAVEVRVSSTRFREALQTLETLGPVTHRSVSAEDVSEQYRDLEVRLSNLKATQKRLQEFLARAQNVAEALTVERELERVALEIDQIEGKLAFLKNRTAFSRITVEISVRKSEAIVAGGGGVSRPKAPSLPVAWLHTVGIEPLLSLR